MILKNVTVIDNADPVSLGISAGAITAADKDNDRECLSLEHAIAFPGLINSHDHLDFNNFPKLGNRVYDDYVAWGNDIHVADKEEIRKVLSIPKELRVRWSLYKNLLNGITTVVQHGEYFRITDSPVNVFQDCVSIHSVQLEKNWKLRLNKPRFNDHPIVIHTGEGNNKKASQEIDQLIRWNVFRKKLIGIHGIAMSPEQAAAFKALVWCPDSNFFLFSRTADIKALKKRVPILFGTDSTLSADWDIWHHLRLAADTGHAGPEELYHMLTSSPARIWNLRNKGSLSAGYAADIVLSERSEGQSFLQSFMAASPARLKMVVCNGNIRLFDGTLFSAMSAIGLDTTSFSKIRVRGVLKYVWGDLPALLHEIRRYHSGFRTDGIEIP